MFKNYHGGLVAAIFIALAVGPGYAKECFNPACSKDSPKNSIYCEKCYYPFPRGGIENGIAIFRFLGVNQEIDPDGEIPRTIKKEIENSGKYEAEHAVVYNDAYGDLKRAFLIARGSQYQLVLVGDVFESGKKFWISAELFDIETGYMIGAGRSYYDKTGSGKSLSEAVEEFVKNLPYRGSYSRSSTFKFKLPPGSKLEGGGRVEILGSYSYPWKFYAGPDADSECRKYLTPVKPKLVIPSLEQYEEKYEVTISENGEGSIKILQTGEVQFKGENTPDICYYYPPEKEISVPTSAKKPWFVYLGGAYARHSYEYAEGLKSREDAGSAEVRVGYHRPWDWPLEVAGGYAAHVPFRYKYEYGGIYEGRGSIKGAYVSSAILAAAWVHSLPVWRFGLLPRLGVEGEYFFPAGNGTYEQEGGWEWYYNELWNGFLLVPKAGVGFNFGPAKQYELMVGVSYSWPLGGNYSRNFGPLLRIPVGIQYYF